MVSLNRIILVAVPNGPKILTLEENHHFFSCLWIRINYLLPTKGSCSRQHGFVQED